MLKAIVSFGSHQYEVTPGGSIEVLRLDRPVGEVFDWDKVNWAVADEGEAKLGRPYVQGAGVRFRVMEHYRDKKIIVFKKRSKKAWKKQRGHRTDLTKLQVEAVNFG